MNELDQKELVCTRLRTAWREDTAELQAEVDKLTWMLDAFMHNRTRYMEIRAGYADIFSIVKQDLEEDYERRFDDE